MSKNELLEGRGPFHHEWSAGPVERGFEFIVGSPDKGHRTILDRVDAEALHEMLEMWLHKPGAMGISYERKKDG